MIDEKKLWDERPEWLNPIQEGREDFNEGWNACNGHWLDLIKAQPTIQGIDKLIEAIETLERELSRQINVGAFGSILNSVNAIKSLIIKQQPADGWIPVSSKGRKGLLGRIAEYFKEWDGQEPAPTMQMSIDDLRTIAAMNVERCALQEEVRKLRLPQPYKEEK